MKWVRRLAQALAAAGEESAPSARVGRRALALSAAACAGLLTPSVRAGNPRSAVDVLVERITFGAKPDDRTQAEQLGYAAYLEWQLAYEAIDDSELDERLAQLSTLTMSPSELAGAPPGQLTAELIEATLLRAVFSRRQLYERMVEFWSDHFNIHVNVGVGLKALDDRQVPRTYALRTFRDLLVASARSPAMIEYLDNSLNFASRPNENYARELMELHTLGVDGGYTQQDVHEVARCFTGWGFFNAYAEPESLRWSFRFLAPEHDNGEKVVLGHVIPAGGGQDDGLMVLDILLDHPKTSIHLARKLCARFWGENPPEELVDAVAATYRLTGGDIHAMLRTLFYTVELAAAPAKFKRPMHLIVSALRATGTNILSTSGLRVHLAQAGHLPFYWLQPNGYPDTYDYWSKLLLPRWNVMVNLCSDAIGGVYFPVDGFLSSAQTPVEIVDRIDAVIFAGRMSATDRLEVLTFLYTGALDALRKREAVALAMSGLSFQWC